MAPPDVHHIVGRESNRYTTRGKDSPLAGNFFSLSPPRERAEVRGISNVRKPAYRPERHGRANGRFDA